MPASINLTINDKSITVSLEDHTPYDVENIKWNFGDGSDIVNAGSYPGSSSHAYENYGNYTVSCSFTYDKGTSAEKSSARTLAQIKDPTKDDGYNNSTIIYDAFALKPIIIPAECTGDISITAEVKELDKANASDKTKSSGSISAYINLTNIEILANQTATFILTDELTVASTFVNANGNQFASISDLKLVNLKNIPSFYTGGTVTIQYTLGSTEDENSNFDLKWDLLMDMPYYYEDMPWYDGDFSTSSQIFKNMIRSDQSESNFPSAAEYTTAFQTFTIDSWSQLPPMVIRQFVDEPATTVAVRRAMLSNTRFHVVLTNNLSSTCILNQATIKFNFSYNPYDIFMNMQLNNDMRKKQARIYTLPKGAEYGRLASVDFPVYAVIDGYRKSEIIKVYATWNEFATDSTDGYYFPTTIQLMPVAGMGGQDEYFPTFLYKSEGNPLKRTDFTRVTDGDWMNSDGVKVLTPQLLASNEDYRVIDVKVVDDKSPDDQQAVFVITTKPNDGIDEVITVDDLDNNIKYIHFFDETVDYAASVQVPRTSIDPMFYETLSSTYNKAPVLESILEEPLYYINFTVNEYALPVPIYDGQTLKFSDSLTHSSDGIRSTDIFYIDGKSPNVFNIQCPTKHKYKVKFHCNHEVYKDVYILTNDDLPEHLKVVDDTTEEV